jgi:hypothetical protein
VEIFGTATPIERIRNLIERLTLIPRLRAVGFTIVGVEGYPIVSTTYRSGDFSHGLSLLIDIILLGR